MTDFVFIDSGVGGIPYMTALLEKEPGASCFYVADNKNFPYGEKSHDEVVECVTAVVEKICKRFDPAVIVLACNTISVNALEVLRQKFPKVQFVGTVPAIKLAASITKNKCIGLLASASTCENPYNIELKNKFASDCKLVMRPDAELISFVEQKGFTASKTELQQAVRPAIEFFEKNDCDVIILGCTHFLNIKNVFNDMTDMKIVDSVDGVVRHALDVAGVLGVEPLGQGVGRNEVRPQGGTPLSLFITGQMNPSYEIICSRYKISFGGNI